MPSGVPAGERGGAADVRLPGGLLTLQRLRTGGNQTVTVQHVNVESGAQAVIGNVRTGGARRRGNNGK